MKNLRILAAACIGVMFMLAAASAAGPGMRGSCGWGAGSDYNRMYDPATVVKFSGTVESVKKVPSRKGMSEGIHIMVESEDPCSMAPVHLGPAWYIENQDTEIKKGDKVTVTGSKVNMDGETVIIAREVEKGNEVLVLRNDAGVPYWSGWRRRMR